VSKVKKSIDLGLVIKLSVPEGMTERTLLDAVFNAMRGVGDPDDGVNMLADIGYYVADKIAENLEAVGSEIEHGGSSGYCPKLEGDTRTPRQRAIDLEAQG